MSVPYCGPVLQSCIHLKCSMSFSDLYTIRFDWVDNAESIHFFCKIDWIARFVTWEAFWQNFGSQLFLLQSQQLIRQEGTVFKCKYVTLLQPVSLKRKFQKFMWRGSSRAFFYRLARLGTAYTAISSGVIGWECLPPIPPNKLRVANWTTARLKHTSIKYGRRIQ